jgi:hypothetical protein
VPNPRNSIIEMEYSWVFENQVCRAAPLCCKWDFLFVLSSLNGIFRLRA